ncbi:MAG: HlyD family efflux transporter periplasmic adaptor subunit [Ignavibacteriaceae bacterium]|nr:HlyD family efflux transporter periplasmic adaptor subunit [Ignavibacteriaceae bacterium]
MKRYFNWIKLFTIGLILPLFFSMCSGNIDELPAGSAPGALVKVASPVRTNLTQYSILNATTVFIKKETVRSTIPGFIKKGFVNIGDFVNPGKDLFVIKTRESSASDSSGIMIGEKLYTGEVLIQAHSSGVVTEVLYNEGDYVIESERLALISVPSSLRLYLDVPYQLVSKINRQTRYAVILPDGKTVYAIVENIVPVIDQVTQTQKYILKFVSNITLPESLNVNLLFPVNRVSNAFAVPKSSVMSHETMDSFWVMKLLNDTISVKCKIQKGIETDSLIEVVNSSLNISDRIIVSGAYGLPDTAKITMVK